MRAIATGIGAFLGFKLLTTILGGSALTGGLGALIGAIAGALLHKALTTVNEGPPSEPGKKG
jgi:hypothetical protein